MAKTVVWCERGCQNHTFTETGISSILGFIWRSFWKQKGYKSGNVAHFGAPVWESGAHCWLAGWLLAGWLAMGTPGSEAIWSGEVKRLCSGPYWQPNNRSC